EGELALDPAEHEPPGHGGDGVGLGAGGQVGEAGGEVARPGVDVDAVGDPARLGAHGWFFSKTRRSPWRVSHGSWKAIMREWGAMTSASPPVATTVASP